MSLPSVPILLPVAHISQREYGDCLVACAAMVLTYLGRPISYNRLLKTLGIQPNVGAPFSNLRASARLKITVIYEQGTLADLHRFLVNGWPYIVPVKSRELPYGENIDTDHALVVVGIAAASVYLNDLAWFERGENYAVLSP